MRNTGLKIELKLTDNRPFFFLGRLTGFGNNRNTTALLENDSELGSTAIQNASIPGWQPGSDLGIKRKIRSRFELIQ